MIWGRSKLIWLTTIILVFIFIIEKPNISMATEEDVISVASEPTNIDPDILVENAINQFLNSAHGKAIRKKITTEGGWIGYAMAGVAVVPENPDWGKYRVLAFEKALTDVENQFLKVQHQSIAAEKFSSFFKNASGVVPDFKQQDMGDPTKMKLLFNKLLAVAEGKIDQILAELEVDKDQFNRTPKAQRHTLLSEEFKKITTMETIGSLAGLIPIKTYEGRNAQKDHVIGVVCISTSKTKQLAYDIVHRRGQIGLTSKKGKNLFELYSNNNNSLLNEFGIRAMKDEEGNKVLVSFGQWSNGKKISDKRLLRRYRKAARMQAESIAKNQVAIFLAGKANLLSNSTVGELYQESYNVHSDNYKEEQIVDSIMDGLREESRSKAKVSISGLTKLYSWTGKHPLYGHEIVGVIMTWSPHNEKQARKLRDWKPNKKIDTNKKPATTTKKTVGSSGVTTGKDYMKLDDF